jgi:hypothetical protein
MNWIKKSLSIGFVIVIFSGCAEIVLKAIGDSVISSLIDIDFDLNENKPIFLESISNNEFKEFIIKNKVINGLNPSEIIYIDNANNRYPSNPTSYKILLTQNAIYLILVDTWQNITRLNKNNYKEFDYSVSKKSYKDFEISTRIDVPSNEFLYIHYTAKKPKKWWQQSHIEFKIKHRYNDIKRIKEIIDERVAYYRKQQLKER